MAIKFSTVEALRKLRGLSAGGSWRPAGFAWAVRFDGQTYWMGEMGYKLDKLNELVAELASAARRS